MRLLSPIMEESANTMINDTTKNANATTNTDLNKSLMTVISDILTNNNVNNGTSISHYGTNLGTNGTNNYGINTTNQITNPDGYFQDSIESQSSLVHTIEEIRNNSMCNLYYTTGTNTEIKSQNPKAAPQVPPRNENNDQQI